MPKYSFFQQLDAAHSIERDVRNERYMSNIRGTYGPGHNREYSHYLHDSQKFRANKLKRHNHRKGRVFIHIADDHHPTGLIYTVSDGKVVGTRPGVVTGS